MLKLIVVESWIFNPGPKSKTETISSTMLKNLMRKRRSTNLKSAEHHDYGIADSRI